MCEILPSNNNLALFWIKEEASLPKNDNACKNTNADQFSDRPIYQRYSCSVLFQRDYSVNSHFSTRIAYEHTLYYLQYSNRSTQSHPTPPPHTHTCTPPHPIPLQTHPHQNGGSFTLEICWFNSVKIVYAISCHCIYRITAIYGTLQKQVLIY